MKSIYHQFLSDVKYSIMVLAQKYGLSPIEILGATEGPVFKELQNEIETIESMTTDLFPDLPVEDINNFFTEIKAEINKIICPGYIETTGIDITDDINRTLIREGYELVSPEVLNLIVDEIITLKPGRCDRS